MRVIDRTGGRIAAAICGVICSLAICGCGKSNSRPGIATLPVTGVVTLDGKPLSGADVLFATAEGASFAARTKDDGSYQLQGLAGRGAACKGVCQVTISRYLKPDGSPLGPEEFPAMVEATESLPPKYSFPGETTLSVDVPEQGGKFDFPLTSQ